MLSSKLDAVAMEYNQLLTSQLESQRQYFEGLIAAARLDADKARLDMDRCGMTDASAAACAPQLGWPDAHTRVCSARATCAAAEARAASAEQSSAALTAENKELEKSRRATERKLEEAQVSQALELFR